MSLLIVGTVAFDEVESPFGKTGKILGGAGTYIGLAASHLTENIGIVSVVGGDFPQKYLDLFKERNIDTSGLRIVKEGKTFFWAGRYHENMNMRDTLVTDLNVLADFDPVVPEHLRKSKYLMLGNLTPAIQRRVIEQMDPRPELIVMDTMNFWMDTALNDLVDVISMVDVLTVNDEEARQLSGEYSLVKAAKKILTMGPRFLIVKKGEHGALLFHENKIFHAPAMPLEDVFDPTGAGDTFAGGFMGYIAKTNDTSFENMKRGIIYGSAMASFTVEKFGTDRLTELSQQDIKKRLQEFVDLVAFEI
ncbi:MAG: bifunctional hydroxymethylpyrimidine kinase/phosphomethylpyrimidine kinase [Bacteroidales bacterium]|nr:bifunctional hydroxymethylpyrimidine kinase/phosphomethylpyrimidine kinase [Bacteroidales bacterium]